MRPTLRKSGIGILALLFAMSACKPSAEQNEAAMIRQAQADAARESAFVADSVRLAATFTVDTVARVFSMQQRTTAADGSDSILVLHVIQGRRGSFCNNMDPRLWSARAAGDTLTCQWTERAEGVSQDDGQ